mgnify:CR=1 FL=1
MNTHEALRLLGVSEDTLSGSQMNQLDDYGHLVVYGLLDEKQLKIFPMCTLWQSVMVKTRIIIKN